MEIVDENNNDIKGMVEIGMDSGFREEAKESHNQGSMLDQLQSRVHESLIFGVSDQEIG